MPVSRKWPTVTDETGQNKGLARPIRAERKYSHEKHHPHD
nr:MAG TPA: hypothetical protein [Caudoviricetes sp.]